MADTREAHPAPAPGEPLLACREVTRTFGRAGRAGEVRVLGGVDLTVGAGEVVVISGRTGAGKSTLLAILAGIDRPTSGSVRVEGCALEDLSGAALARVRQRKIGIVFQSFNLLASWTAAENVEAALVGSGLARADRRAKAAALLADLGLGDRLDHLPAELSVGQQQCVAIARALANRPRLLIADEPTGDVDALTAGAIVGHLLEPVRAYGAALVVATHGSFPPQVPARRMRMEGGVLVAEPAAGA
jgi:putative ABC transport system ATP-binding protein